MGVKERRAREKAQKRQTILNEALVIISEKGFSAFSMRKLAERIEYSAASIYLYFENRDRLAQELREFGFEQLLQKLNTAITGVENHKVLNALGAAYVEFGLEQPELYKLIFMGDSEYMKAAYAENTADNAAARSYKVLLRVAQQFKSVSQGKTAPTVIADVIWSCLHGIVSLRLACSALQGTSPEILAQVSTELLAKGLEQALS